MATLGLTDESLATSSNNIYPGNSLAQIFTMPENGTLDSVHIYGANAGGTCGLAFVVYDVTAGDPDNILFESATAPTLADYTPLWRQIAAGGEMLVSGNQYAIGFIVTGSGQFQASYQTGGGTDHRGYGAQTFPGTSPWVSDTDFTGRIYAAYITYSTPVAPLIATIDSPVLDGSTGNAFTVSNFGSGITSFTIDDGVHTLDLSASLSGTYTYDFPDITGYTVDTAGILFGVNTATVGDGVDTATSSIIVNPKSGYAYVSLNTGLDTTTLGTVMYGWTGAPILNDQIYYPTASNTSVDANGVLTTDLISGSIDMFYIDKTDGMVKPFTIILSGQAGGGYGNALKSSGSPVSTTRRLHL